MITNVTQKVTTLSGTSPAMFDVCQMTIGLKEPPIRSQLTHDAIGAGQGEDVRTSLTPTVGTGRHSLKIELCIKGRRWPLRCSG